MDFKFTLLLLNEGDTGLPHEFEAAVRAAIKQAAETTMKSFNATVEVKTGYMETK